MRKTLAAFSLVEVVVALGMIAVTMTALLGLLSALQSQGNDSDERSRSLTAASAAAAFLRSAGFNETVSHAVSPGATASTGQRIYLGRDLVKTGWDADVPTSERFYAVTIERITDISPAGSDFAAGFIAVTLRVEWPAAALDGSSASNVSVLRSNFVISR